MIVHVFLIPHFYDSDKPEGRGFDSR
jgi:hypothetical protein